MTTIWIPQDAAARSLGADLVSQAIADQAAARGLSLDLRRNGSRGMLFLEPLVEVLTPTGRVGYGPVQVQDIPGLFEAGFLDGRAHDKNIGLVEEHPWMKGQDRLVNARVGLIEPLSFAQWTENGGGAGLAAARCLRPEQIVQLVTDSGLRGRGGAGFPTGIKWKTVLDTPADQKYIVCNADEGDSGTFSDRMLMEGDPFTLFEGMAIAGLAVGADLGYIYLRSEYPNCERVLKAALPVARENGLLGPQFDIVLRRGAGSYVCGEETALLESLEGRRGQVRPRPPMPAQVGLFGKPTALNNVVTLGSVPAILAQGAQAYAARGVGRSKGTLPIQLAGNIRRGGLVELPFGITLRALVEDWGGGTRSGLPVRAVQVGGPLGSWLPASALDVPLDYEALSANGAILGHGGIVVVDERADMASLARYAMEFCAVESCGKCTPCRIGSTRGVEVIDRILAGDRPPAQVALLRDLCDTLSQASLCALGGLTPLPVLSALDHFPEDFGLAPKPTPPEVSGPEARDV